MVTIEWFYVGKESLMARELTWSVGTSSRRGYLRNLASFTSPYLHSSVVPSCCFVRVFCFPHPPSLFTIAVERSYYHGFHQKETRTQGYGRCRGPICPTFPSCYEFRRCSPSCLWPYGLWSISKARDPAKKSARRKSAAPASNSRARAPRAQPEVVDESEDGDEDEGDMEDDGEDDNLDDDEVDISRARVSTDTYANHPALKGVKDPVQRMAIISMIQKQKRKYELHQLELKHLAGGMGEAVAGGGASSGQQVESNDFGESLLSTQQRQQVQLLSKYSRKYVVAIARNTFDLGHLPNLDHAFLGDNTPDSVLRIDEASGQLLNYKAKGKLAFFGTHRRSGR